MFLSDKEPTLETLDFTIRIGSTPTFLYFDNLNHSSVVRKCVNIVISVFGTIQRFSLLMDG